MLDEKIKTEGAVRPAQRWRNKWRVFIYGVDCYSGDTYGPGEVWGSRIFPCEDTARTDAARICANNARFKNTCPPEYLGAFPV